MTKKTRNELKAELNALAASVPDLREVETKWYDKLNGIAWESYKYDLDEVEARRISSCALTVWRNSRMAEKSLIKLTLELLANTL